MLICTEAELAPGGSQERYLTVSASVLFAWRRRPHSPAPTLTLLDAPCSVKMAELLGFHQLGHALQMSCKSKSSLPNRSEFFQSVNKHVDRSDLPIECILAVKRLLTKYLTKGS